MVSVLLTPANSAYLGHVPTSAETHARMRKVELALQIARNGARMTELARVSNTLTMRTFIVCD